MNAVVYYSNTGQSKAIAEFLANRLDYSLLYIEKMEFYHFDNLVLVFPVHCQNIPSIVKDFLLKIKTNNLSAIATYGKMCFGNVLYEIQQNYCKNIVAGAYIPTKHSYIDEDDSIDFEQLIPFVEKVNNPSRIKIPRSYKNPFANLLPRLRGLLGLKIVKTPYCNECGACTECCSFDAIESGITNNKCIRCLKCVYNCPKNALTFKLGLPLKLYLSKKKVDKIVIYI